MWLFPQLQKTTTPTNRRNRFQGPLQLTDFNSTWDLPHVDLTMVILITEKNLFSSWNLKIQNCKEAIKNCQNSEVFLLIFFHVYMVVFLRKLNHTLHWGLYSASYVTLYPECFLMLLIFCLKHFVYIYCCEITHCNISSHVPMVGHIGSFWHCEGHLSFFVN